MPDSFFTSIQKANEVGVQYSTLYLNKRINVSGTLKLQELTNGHLVMQEEKTRAIIVTNKNRTYVLTRTQPSSISLLLTLCTVQKSMQPTKEMRLPRLHAPLRTMDQL